MCVYIVTCVLISHSSLPSSPFPFCPSSLPPLSPQIFTNTLNSLELKVFQRYIDKKMNPLLETVLQGMTAGYFQWDCTSLPIGVRPYVREALVYLVHVHAEVRPHPLPRPLNNRGRVLGAQYSSGLCSSCAGSNNGNINFRNV